jgi:hypothetical protein
MFRTDEKMEFKCGAEKRDMQENIGFSRNRK